MAETPDAQYGWNPEMSIPLLLKLKADLKTALLQKNQALKDAVRQIMSEFPKLTVPLTLESGKKSFRLKTQDEITDDDILHIIRGLVKSEKSVLEIRTDQSQDYLHILESYLPRMAEASEIIAWVDANIDFRKFKSPMMAMGPIMKHFGKKVDGNMVKAILSEKAKA
ncbi:MAG: GatB/YqeY domain-containing protein [Desulfatirhabdiaceae bacterium]